MGPVGLGEPAINDKTIEYSSFEFKKQKYNVGDSVYLPSDTHQFPVKRSKANSIKSLRKDFPDPSDEVTYPELYRKSEYVKGSNTDVPKPFQIGKDQHIVCLYILTILCF